jgi:hypothetical protein
VQAFPVQTISLEYDNLASLRLLPNYASLRQQYSGEGLQRVQKALLSLGISEDQLSEVVTASGQNGFFGLLAGSFRPVLAREAVKHGMTQSVLEEGTVICSKEDICFSFPAGEIGHALFGTLAQLRAISDVRMGRSASMRANPTFLSLLNRMAPRAPVFGFAPGREIGLNLVCSSDTAAIAVRDTLDVASGLQRAAASVAGSAALPFENLAAHSSGRLVAVILDAPIQ